MIEWFVRLAERPFRGHPGFNGFLLGLGFLVLYVIVAPPRIWGIERLFSPVLGPVEHTVMWWWKLWS
jgi:hypothetical protein